MVRWVTTTKPKAQLTELPELHFINNDGDAVRIFQTAFGTQFAEVVEVSGFVLWLRKLESNPPPGI